MPFKTRHKGAIIIADHSFEVGIQKKCNNILLIAVINKLYKKYKNMIYNDINYYSDT